MLPHRSLVSSTIWSVLFRYAPFASTTTPPKQTHSRAKPANYADNGGRSITSPFFSKDAYSFSILLSRFACNSLSPTPHPRVLRARIARFFFCVRVRLWTAYCSLNSSLVSLFLSLPLSFLFRRLQYTCNCTAKYTFWNTKIVLLVATVFPT